MLSCEFFFLASVNALVVPDNKHFYVNDSNNWNILKLDWNNILILDTIFQMHKEGALNLAITINKNIYNKKTSLE